MGKDDQILLFIATMLTTRPHLLVRQLDRQGVELVSLVVAPKPETKVLLQIVHYPPHKTAAVQEDGRGEVL